MVGLVWVSFWRNFWYGRPISKTIHCQNINSNRYAQHIWKIKYQAYVFIWIIHHTVTPEKIMHNLQSIGQIFIFYSRFFHSWKTRNFFCSLLLSSIGCHYDRCCISATRNIYITDVNTIIYRVLFASIIRKL